MSINYDGRTFRSIENTDNGEVSGETVFHYHQKGDLVWAEYSGGSIVEGHLIASVLEDGRLEMRYHHLNMDGDLMAGKCLSTPTLREDGKIELAEKWQWFTGDRSKGASTVVED